MPRANAPKQRSKKTPRTRTVRSRGPLPVVIRDPLSEENAINYGDLRNLPRMFRQPQISNQTFFFQRRVGSADITQVAGSDAFQAYRFQINDITNTGDFTGLFDQYRFVAVKMEFRPRFNYANPGSVAANKLPRLFSVIDYDDANVPTLISDLREYHSCKETNTFEDHVRLIKPRMATAALNAAAGLTSLVNEKAKWIDMAYLTVTHYGVKIGIEGGVGGQTNLQSWSVDLVYMMEFRQVR